MYPRRTSLSFLLSILLLPPLGFSAAKPNVLILLTDDQGYGELSVHGNPVLKTPHLDRLHSESVRFTDFHVAPVWATPTRSQLLTGSDALRNGTMNVSSGRTLLRREFPTMAGIFAAAGYATGLFGKWHLGDNYPFRPQDRGFQETLWYPSSHIGSAPDFWGNDYFDDTYWYNGHRRAYTGYTTDVFFDEAMRWMRAQTQAGKAFLCYLPTAAQRTNLVRYLAMISNLDDNLGRLEAFLRDTGLRDNTLVIFMTDNGSTFGPRYFNSGMKGGKITLWEGGHRVPCFVRWRLVQDKELYDLSVDPAQEHNIIAERLDIATRLRAHYAKWWEGVAARINEPVRVVIGHNAENPGLLSPCEWRDVFLDQGAQVRRGERKNGVWHLEVAQAGDYVFELRRWPREQNTPLAAALPAVKSLMASSRRARPCPSLRHG